MPLLKATIIPECKIVIPSLLFGGFSLNSFNLEANARVEYDQWILVTHIRCERAGKVTLISLDISSYIARLFKRD